MRSGWDCVRHLYLHDNVNCNCRARGFLLQTTPCPVEILAVCRLLTLRPRSSCSFKDDKTAYACGGSGSLYRSEDGGKSWKRDRNTDDIAGNLYAIKFFNPSLGFVLGNDGILLRYSGSA